MILDHKLQTRASIAIMGVIEKEFNTAKQKNVRWKITFLSPHLESMNRNLL